MEFHDKIDCYINDYYKNNKNTGIIRVTSKDEVIYERYVGFSNIENKTEFSSKSMFTFYSLSKPFLVIGLLKLKDKNLIDIDCHPGKYVPEAKGFDERVTIRHMLHHISGLPDFVLTAGFDKKYICGLPEHMREHLKELTEYPMVFTPGTQGMYANVNMIPCALMIENITGMKYADYMKKEVFSPLGMVTAQVDDINLSVANRVTGYDLYGDKVSPAKRCTDWLLGAGDIIGTVDDVYCLNLAIKNKMLLKAQTWDEILTPSPISSMGMGCTVNMWHGKKRIIHNGGHTGFRTLHMQIPEDDFDIIILSNSGWGNARYDIAEAIYESYHGSDMEKSDRFEMDKGYI